MCSRKMFLLGLTVSLLAFSDGCALFQGQTPGRGALLEKWQTENKMFKVRVTSYEERDANVNGAYYQFDSSLSGSNDWHEIVTFRHDDRPKIPEDQVRFVNDHIGYLFMGWMYAVTTDSGRTWSVWTAERDLPNWQCCNYKLIGEVTIENDGTGMMKLNPIKDRRGEVPRLRTVDYGKNWRPE